MQTNDITTAGPLARLEVLHRQRVLTGLFTVVVVVLYVALPNKIADTMFQIVAWGSIVVFVLGLRRHGGITLPWFCIIAGWCCFAMGDFLFSFFEYVLHTSPFPSAADVFYVAGYPFLAAGESCNVCLCSC